MRRNLRRLSILGSLFLAGCGTCGDLMCGLMEPDGPYFYRGVRNDLAVIHQENSAMAAMAAADIPLSAVADTVLIPLDCIAMGCMRLPLSQPLPKYDLPKSNPSDTSPVSVGFGPDESQPR